MRPTITKPRLGSLGGFLEGIQSAGCPIELELGGVRELLLHFSDKLVQIGLIQKRQTDPAPRPPEPDPPLRTLPLIPAHELEVDLLVTFHKGVARELPSLDSV